MDPEVAAALAEWNELTKDPRIASLMAVEFRRNALMPQYAHMARELNLMAFFSEQKHRPTVLDAIN